MTYTIDKCAHVRETERSYNLTILPLYYAYYLSSKITNPTRCNKMSNN